MREGAFDRRPDALEAALAGADDRDRLVLELRYGLNGGEPQSLARIGTLLGVSRDRVRQLESRALMLLRSPVTAAKAPPARPKPPLRPAATGRGRFLRPWILVLLSLEPMYGLELNKRLGEPDMPPAGYRLLRGLEREGLLESVWVTAGRRGPDRRVYSLTSKGAEELKRHARSLGKTAQTLERFLARAA